MSDTAFVLIVEPDPEAGRMAAEEVKRAGHVPRIAASTAEALESLRQRPPDVVVAPFGQAATPDDIEILQAAHRAAPEAEVILLVSAPDRDTAIRAVESTGPGRAFDYLVLPPEPKTLRDAVARAAQKAIAARENRLLREATADAFNFEGLIGRSPMLAKEIRRIQKVARSKSTVLVIGETGTGKELIAQAIHNISPRAGKPFKVINCAALSETLLESELFGHVKGAFTGAVSDKKGILEAADGGTLFLDEIGDMPLSMQAKLLRTLETGEVQPVGSHQSRRVDVRFVAATHRNLQESVKNGLFREDLLYRLDAQGAIRIPPLRERREDIPLLVHHFIQQANRENGLAIEGITTEAMRKLTNHAWPGNVRELRNVVQSMVIESEGKMLGMEDLPDSLKGTTDIVIAGGAPSLVGLSMAEVERLHIINTLRVTGGNREKAARILKISPRTLYRKLREYGLN
jgi:DNA-binding NtrC family response regulator